MRNLTNTMIAWTPPTRLDYDTAGQIALIEWPWHHGPFPYARDFGASMLRVRESSLEERKRMLVDVIDRISQDGIAPDKVANVMSQLEEW
jgi:hypothetical protein